MNLLLYLNYHKNRYSPVDMRCWCKGILNACRQSNGSMRAFVLFDKNVESSLARLGESVPYAVLNSSDLAVELQQIKRKRFNFDGVLLMGRDGTMETAAKRLHIFCLAFAKPPQFLDIWMLHSFGNNIEAIVSKPQQFDRLNDGFDGELLPFLPSFESYYQRYTPCTGRYAEMIYQAKKKKLLVPLFFYYHKQGRDQFMTAFFDRLGRLARKNNNLCIMLMPMSPRADRLKLFWSPSRENYVWLEKADGRDQLLSLMDKVDGVLALDNTAALLPLMLAKPVCKDVKCSFELARHLPQVTDWLAGEVGFGEYARLRKNLINHLFTHIIIPPQYDALLRICESNQEQRKVNMDNARFWSVNRCYSSMVAQRTVERPKVWIRKMRKLKRDPHAFCNDSTNSLVHSAKWLFTPLPDIFANNRRP